MSSLSRIMLSSSRKQWQSSHAIKMLHDNNSVRTTDILLLLNINKKTDIKQPVGGGGVDQSRQSAALWTHVEIFIPNKTVNIWQDQKH